MHLRLPIIAPLTLLLCLGAGCRDSGGETDRDLARQLERRAASRPKKASVTLGSIHHFDGISADEPVAAELGDAGRIEVRAAYLVVSAVELHACEPGLDDYDSPGAPLLNSIWPLFGGTARAHVPSSSTRLGTPFVDDLLGKPDSASIVGEISPPLAAYCRLYAVVAPADRDVVNSTSLPTDDIVGKSLLVRGRFKPKPDADWRDFEIAADTARPIEINAVDPQTGQSPLVLKSPDRSVMLLLDKTIRPSTFSTDPTADHAASDILDRLAETLRVHTY